MLSEAQRNDINFAIPVLEHINIEGGSVLADRGYDSQNLMAISMKMAGSQPSHPKKEPNLSAVVAGGCTKSAIW
nr:transposase [uncultured Acetatifactor sp.]